MKRIGTPGQAGQILKDFRLAKGLNQGEVGGLSGVRQATVSDLERNAGNAKVETLFKVAAALGLDIYLVEKSTARPETGDEHW
jgi:HTH-type transcriptional regulator/antitoxin HipB